MSETTRKSKASAKRGSSSAVRIMEAAKLEFARHGLGGARIDEIARIAGVSQQLIFHYFQNKETLYAETLILLADESAQFMKDIDFETMHPLEAIEFIARGIFTENQTYGARFIADQIVQSGAQISNRNRIATYHQRLEKIIDSVLRRGRRMGEFSPTIGARELLMAMISLSMGQSAALGLLGSDEAGSPAPDAREWMDFGVQFIRRALTNVA